jgi:pyruvate/2-oxoglutarate dehydrogenase complex dihydrolipoamide acyltransferase (E2) component
MKPRTIPAWVRKGARLKTGDLIGPLGNSGNSDAPYLHFQVRDGPSFLDATGLPFEFASQFLEGRVSESAAADLAGVAPVYIDRTGAGLRRSDAGGQRGVRLQPVPVAAPAASSSRSARPSRAEKRPIASGRQRRLASDKGRARLPSETQAFRTAPLRPESSTG